MKKTSFLIVLLIILFQSCITIKQSPNRIHEPQPIETGNCKISSTGAVYMNILGIIKVNFVTAGIKIDFNGRLLYVDPLVVDDSTKADFIFFTHNHPDHFSKADYTKLSKPGTIFVCPETISGKLNNQIVKTVHIGDTSDFGNIKYQVVESYNLNSGMHKKGDKNVGYIISCDSTRIYIAGDTDFIPEMEKLKNITVAIIPIGEGKTAMNPQAASKAVNLIKPEIVIPIHYNIGKNKEKEFTKLVDKNIEVRLFPLKEN
jgi:L-ascorbate metabolism protein UlaG (beta-lactamase superfamily)